MIAVDTSALIAIVRREPQAAACLEALAAEDEVRISAGTLAEALIVAGRRNFAEELDQLLERLRLDVVTVTPAAARRIGEAYSRWGKGVHPAGLNLGDCFAYEAAKAAGCPLLFVGDDFARTDVRSVL